MGRKPSVDEIQTYLNITLPWLRGAHVELVSARNHLVYRLEKDGQSFALRMINPESYRRHEWVSMAEEYAILKAIEPNGLGPRVYALDEQFSPPFLIQEFVEATCFNDLKPLSGEQLIAVARAIAVLNSMDVSPEYFPFMQKYVRRGYEGSKRSWFFRLADSIRRMPRRDVLRWTLRILPLVRQTASVIRRFEGLLPQRFSFHFDGAHTGNTYWRDGRVLSPVWQRVIFLDWQKVSYRNDPTYTLVRFATSVDEKGKVPDATWETLLSSYLEMRPVPDFREFARARLLERQTADLVWVLWDSTRRKERRQVEAATSVVRRYEEVSRLLRAHAG